MITYSEFQPTVFDSKGAFLPDRQDWIVVLAGRTRDSGALEQSNFATALKRLGGESNSVEVHRFDHWTVGWLEIILVERGSDQVHIADAIEDALADYPVLDDDDYADRQAEELQEQSDYENCPTTS